MLSWSSTRYQSIHHVGKDREYFGNENKRQPVQLFDIVKIMNTAEAKTLRPTYFISEFTAKIATPPVNGEKLVKPATTACEVRFSEKMLYLP